MGKKKIFILDGDSFEYVGKIKNGKTILNRSNSDIWNSHVRNEEIGRLNDDGNGIRIQFGECDTYLDYSAFCDLTILLNLKVKTDLNLMSEITYLEKMK